MKNLIWLLFLVVAEFAGGSVLAQEKGKDDVFGKMLSFSAPGKNHAIFEGLLGRWTFQDKELAFVKGTIERKAIYEGRFFVVEMTGGKLEIPVAGGKMKEANYQSMQVEGFDNVKEKFISISINDHIGSDIEMQTGVYDPATKTFTYEWESELVPGMKTKDRKVLKMIDKDHYSEEYFEMQNGTDVKVRALDFVRVNAAK